MNRKSYAKLIASVRNLQSLVEWQRIANKQLRSYRVRDCGGREETRDIGVYLRHGCLLRTAIWRWIEANPQKHSGHFLRYIPHHQYAEMEHLLLQKVGGLLKTIDAYESVFWAQEKALAEKEAELVLLRGSKASE